MKTSIIDVPRKYTQEDLFGIRVYQDALVEYIRNAETPITIALQGEWGSGKTSLMNLLRWELCDKEGTPYFPIWINTWQFSLMKTPTQAIMSILEGIINQIGMLDPSEKSWAESKQKIGKIFGKIAMAGTKMAAGAVGIDSNVIDDVAGVFAQDNNTQSEIMQLKGEITNLIGRALEHNPQKSGFTFYIDDLDRIDPPVAVEILELLKNIFDLDKCIFVLAIDYDVVIKGLKPKFGELTDQNEREFRSFFDKIIQLPFSMPVGAYRIDTFLVDALSKIALFTPEELQDQKLTEDLSEIARLSVGSNPRSLKRLTNTLSLISIINANMKSEAANDTKSKLINFALVCLQIAYPYIYNQLTDEPDFKSWNENIASKLKMRQLTEAEKQSLNATTEFDEEWEKIVFRMCQKETFLSNRVFQISSLLNKIADIIGNNGIIGETIESIIQMSAVTNLKAFDSVPKLTVNRDTSNYRYNGEVYTAKTDLIRSVLRDILTAHPDYTLVQIQNMFAFKKNMNTEFMSEEMYRDFGQNDPKKLTFFKDIEKAQDSDFLAAADCRFVICSNWPTTVNGKPSKFMLFLDLCKKNGINVDKC